MTNRPVHFSTEETLRNIRLVIAYDGTDFSGWQRQDGKNGGGQSRRTVQGEIEAALAVLHKHPVALTGSGRTDAGVHAKAQAANFYTDITGMEAGRFVPALNSLLSPDIRIMEAGEAPPQFHSRFDAASRTYRYFFIPRRQALPWERRYACQLWRQPDISLLNEYCRFLRGEFDCTVFAAPTDKSRSRHRYLYGACFFAEKNRLVFEIRANAFLWKMFRSIGGTLLFYEEKKTSPETFRSIINSGKRELAGPTLPPEGLFLWSVEYPS
ncbi:MAG: tRNA pseudouridine(38-40) synthase TruA [Spirochaetaceae bacterium]|jgi:tRNA pseudouridine38-40 synthase|nr:tRNA pseudouridine(38-40) synthase TruA [Spirochaetaceae bacterium]